MSSTRLEPGPTRIAVFGSVTVPPPQEAEPVRVTRVLSPNAAAVLDRALELVAANSPGIACPILDRALAAGTISAAERADLLSELVGAPGSSLPTRTEAARRLRHEVRAAIGRAAPGLARPLLDEAVASERLTRAQEVRILERLSQSSPRPVSSFM